MPDQAFVGALDDTDVIRTAVSLGGDCDTLTCIAGSSRRDSTVCRKN